MKKIAVIFPGIGYTADKPLLYYSIKLAAKSGYEICKVEYGGFPSDIKGNKEKMAAAAQMALEQARAMLADVNWQEYDDILFISKSVGTVVASAYAEELNRQQVKTRSILYTPLAETFDFGQTEAIAFHGTADPWAKTEEITRLCEEHKVPLYITKDANHSLETGNIGEDIREIEKIMKIVEEVF